MLPFFRYAILGSDGEPKECDGQTWIKWFMKHGDSASRRVAQDQIGDYNVSTVFVGCGLTLFETAVFNPEGKAISQERNDTRKEAMAAHTAAKDRLALDQATKDAFESLGFERVESEDQCEEND
jgi:hypothetical protein